MISINEFLWKLKHELGEWMSRRIEDQLETEVEAWLHRRPHERRQGVGQRGTGAVCCRCASRRAQAFSRNGHRPRQLVTMVGVLTFWLPRVVCDCGGSVRLPFSILKPYQRFWQDMVDQIDRWANLGLSLRQMQAEIGVQMHTQVGLHQFKRDLIQQAATIFRATTVDGACRLRDALCDQ